jgi:hypothetical protein
MPRKMVVSLQSRTVKVLTCQPLKLTKGTRPRQTAGTTRFSTSPKPRNSLLQGVSRLFPRAPAKPAWIDGRRQKFNAPVEDPIGSNLQRLATKQMANMPSVHHGAQFPRPKDLPSLSTCLIGVNGGVGSRWSFWSSGCAEDCNYGSKFRIFKEGPRQLLKHKRGGKPGVADWLIQGLR